MLSDEIDLYSGPTFLSGYRLTTVCTSPAMSNMVLMKTKPISTVISYHHPKINICILIYLL